MKISPQPRRMLGVLLTSKPSILLFSMAVASVSSVAMFHAVRLLGNGRNDFNEIGNMLNGIATILVAYGVALEERACLLKFFDLAPLHIDIEDRPDNRLCHFFGAMTLILGLLMETSVEAVRLPTRVLDTEGIEGAVFAIGIFFCSISIALLFRHSFLFLRASSAAAESALDRAV